ncbi:MAG: hypothetical protein U0795_01770 [Pirellulales bacterium]
MNTASRSGCGRCQEPAAQYQLWCTRCGNPLPADTWHSAPSSTQTQGPLRQSIELYRRVLDDAARLAQQHDINGSDLATIERLYGGLLARQQEALRQQELRDARQHGLNRIRLLIQPHVNQLNSALDIARQARRDFPDDPVLTDLVQQIEAEQQRRQRLAQSELEAQRLLQNARQLVRNEPAAAKQLLVQGLNLSPQHPELLQTLHQVEQQLAVARATATAAGNKAAADRSVMEQLVPAEIIPSQSVPSQPIPLTSSPLTAEVGAPATVAPVNVSGPREPAEPEVGELGPSTWERIVETTSEWSSLLKPFLLDNVGWFVGAFLIIAGFVVLIVAFRQDIGENPILMWSIVFWTLMSTTGAFFALAYLIRRRYPQLETTSNVLLTIVALLIPLVFAAAALTTMAV